MDLNKHIVSETDNYYVPFLDLMSGVVFILMIILSTELIDIKYSDVQTSSQATPYKNLNQIELFKRDFVSAISDYLNKNKIMNTISRDYNNIVIRDHRAFQDRPLSLTKEGKTIALKISEAFNENLFSKIKTDEKFKKNIEYIKSISINVCPPLSENFESAMIAKSFIFYGYLVDTNSSILLFSNNYSPHLFRISDMNFTSLPFLKNIENISTDIILLNFEFCYPKEDQIIW